MPIFTKNGDNGTTYLISNVPASKGDLIFEVLGTFDELNSVLGLLLAKTNFTSDANGFLVSIQRDLFELGSLIANPDSQKKDFDWLGHKIALQEELILDLETKLPVLKNFILPGGSEHGALAHYARTVCRRLERRLVVYSNQTQFVGGEFCIPFINRLSDLLFCLARFLNFADGYKENIWTTDGEGSL